MNFTTYVPIPLNTYDIGQNFVNPKFDCVVFENELYTCMIYKITLTNDNGQNHREIITLCII